MALRPLKLLHAISLLIIVASLISARAKGEHANIRSDVLQLNWHNTFNSSMHIVLWGPGSAPRTPLTSPFGTIFVVHDSFTDRVSKYHVGTGQGTFVISSHDGLTSLMSITMSLNYHKYLGSLSFVGLLTANVQSKIPIVGGTGDFLFAQGYMLWMPPKDATTYTVVIEVDLHVYWPLSISE